MMGLTCGSLQAQMAVPARADAKRAAKDCGKGASWKVSRTFPCRLGVLPPTPRISRSHDGGVLSNCAHPVL